MFILLLLLFLSLLLMKLSRILVYLFHNNMKPSGSAISSNSCNIMGPT